MYSWYYVTSLSETTFKIIGTYALKANTTPNNVVILLPTLGLFPNFPIALNIMVSLNQTIL